MLCETFVLLSNTRPLSTIFFTILPVGCFKPDVIVSKSAGEKKHSYNKSHTICSSEGLRRRVFSIFFFSKDKIVVTRFHIELEVFILHPSLLRFEGRPTAQSTLLSLTPTCCLHYLYHPADHLRIAHANITETNNAMIKLQ